MMSCLVDLRTTDALNVLRLYKRRVVWQNFSGRYSLTIAILWLIISRLHVIPLLLQLEEIIV